MIDIAAIASREIKLSFNLGRFRDYQALRDEHIKIIGADGTEVEATREHPGFPQLDVTPEIDGPFTVIIDDPNFERFERKNVSRGETVRVRLTGTARLKLDVRDPNDKPVHRFELILTTSGGMNSPAQLLSGKSELEDGIVPGIVPGAYEMMVRTAEGVARLELPEIKAKELREVTVRLDPIVRVRGQVLYPDGEPAVGAEVLLIQPAQQDDSANTRILMGRSSRPTPRFRTLAGRNDVAADGTYSVDAPSVGQYLLIAYERGKTRVVSEIFDVDQSGTVRDLELPRGALLEGHVELPTHLKDARWEVYFEREDYRPELDRFARAPRLDSLGEFSLVGLPAGPTDVYLHNPGSHSQRTATGRPRDSYLIGSVDLEEGGAHKASFKLVGDVPSLVTAKLTSTERLGESAEVHLQPMDATSPNSGVTLSGAIESLSSEVVSPGTYRVMIKGDGWAVLNHDPIVVASGEVVEVPIDVETKECTLQVFVDGKPAAGRSIEFHAKPRVARGLSAKCDQDGFVTVRIDAGSLTAEVFPDVVGGVLMVLPRLDLAWPPESESLHFAKW